MKSEEIEFYNIVINFFLHIIELLMHTICDVYIILIIFLYHNKIASYHIYIHLIM